MKSRVVLALSLALVASPVVAQSLQGAIQSLGSGDDAGAGTAPQGNGNGNANALINSEGDSGLAQLQGQESNADDDSGNALTASDDGDGPMSGNDDTGQSDSPLAGLQERSAGENGGDRDAAAEDDSSPLAGLEGTEDDAETAEDGDTAGDDGQQESPVALQTDDEAAPQEGGEPGSGSQSPLDELVTVENRDDQLIVGARMDGRDRFGEVHEGFVPFASAELVLSPEALSGALHAEESDDRARIAGLLSQDRSFLDAQGRGDERVDTETERDAGGLFN